MEHLKILFHNPALPWNEESVVYVQKVLYMACRALSIPSTAVFEILINT